MMKVLLSAASLAVLAGTAFAADLPSRKEPVIAPPPPPPPMWAGFYAGLNAGGVWSNSNSSQLAAWPVDSVAADFPAYWAPLNGSIGSASNGGFIGGGQIGYNWQANFNNYGFVVGVEADIQGTAGAGGNRVSNSVYPGPLEANSNRVLSWTETIWNNANSRSNLDYIGTVRGRVGFLVTPALLVYGAGGFAYGGLSMNVAQTQTSNFTRTQLIGPNAGATISGGRIALSGANYSSTQVGYAVGGGLEWMFLPDWSVKAEYLYYDLGNVSVSSISTSAPYGGLVENNKVWTGSAITSRVTGNIVRAGVNYHFNFGASPVVAKY